MPTDHFVEVHQETWFDRVKSSIKGIATGICMFVIAFPVLFLNEHNAAKTAQGLEEGAGSVVHVAADQINSSNEGKLVHLTGNVTVAAPISDPEFGISVKGLKLRRKVEMYQWKEVKKSEKEKNTGGSSTTTTSYDYQREWAPEVIRSNDFRLPSGHQNPTTMPFQTIAVTAENPKVGEFLMDAAVVEKLDKFEPVPIEKETLTQVPAVLRGNLKTSQGMLYWGTSPDAPKIGDLRISFEVVKPDTISVVAKQTQQGLAAYHTTSGTQIALVQTGTVTAETMFQQAQSQNTLVTWFLRLFGWVLMFGGITLVFQPLVILADVIPLVGSFVDFGIRLFAGMVSAVLALVTIALSWVFVRPVAGVLLLTLAFGLFGGMVFLALKKRKAQPALA
ncbi:MAG: TMEM43 family protein [Blastocatellia bacterium]|nr:TMEM43 family protein [Blastocatellia bacterium]